MKNFVLGFTLALCITGLAEDASKDVQIGVKCGTLVGQGAVIVADPTTEQIFTLPFTCGGDPI